jgi:hypothetical protein
VNDPDARLLAVPAIVRDPLAIWGPEGLRGVHLVAAQACGSLRRDIGDPELPVGSARLIAHDHRVGDGAAIGREGDLADVAEPGEVATLQSLGVSDRSSDNEVGASDEERRGLADRAMTTRTHAGFSAVEKAEKTGDE